MLMPLVCHGSAMYIEIPCGNSTSAEKHSFDITIQSVKYIFYNSLKPIDSLSKV